MNSTKNYWPDKEKLLECENLQKFYNITKKNNRIQDWKNYFDILIEQNMIFFNIYKKISRNHQKNTKKQKIILSYLENLDTVHFRLPVCISPYYFRIQLNSFSICLSVLTTISLFSLFVHFILISVHFFYSSSFSLWIHLPGK
jgi:hypothetical protein